MKNIKPISQDVVDFDNRLESWNELRNTLKNKSNIEIFTLVTQWWSNYPLKSNTICNLENPPKHVWSILKKYKITKIDQLYGIYYTLNLIEDNDEVIKMFEIQNFENNYDISVDYHGLIWINGAVYDDRCCHEKILSEIPVQKVG